MLLAFVCFSESFRLKFSFIFSIHYFDTTTWIVARLIHEIVIEIVPIRICGLTRLTVVFCKFILQQNCSKLMDKGSHVFMACHTTNVLLCDLLFLAFIRQYLFSSLHSSITSLHKICDCLSDLLHTLLLVFLQILELVSLVDDSAKFVKLQECFLLKCQIRQVGSSRVYVILVFWNVCTSCQLFKFLHLLDIFLLFFLHFFARFDVVVPILIKNAIQHFYRLVQNILHLFLLFYRQGWLICRNFSVKYSLRFLESFLQDWTWLLNWNDWGLVSSYMGNIYICSPIPGSSLSLWTWLNDISFVPDPFLWARDFKSDLGLWLSVCFLSSVLLLFSSSICVVVFIELAEETRSLVDYYRRILNKLADYILFLAWLFFILLWIERKDIIAAMYDVWW